MNIGVHVPFQISALFLQIYAQEWGLLGHKAVLFLVF